MLNFKAFLFIILCVTFQKNIAQSEATVINNNNEFKKLDSNGNDVLERRELSQIWKQARKLDVNEDKRLSTKEFSEFKIPYLKTKGNIVLNIKYKVTEEGDLYFDVYYPTTENEHKKQKYPFVFYTHGGGWFNGSKENAVRPPVKNLLLKAIENGYAVVSVNYRLTKLKTVLMRDCVIDAMDALRYISKNSTDLKLDTNNVFAFGDSAGGHIAQMITLADPNKFEGDKKLYHNSYKVVAGISWYGPSDFTVKSLFETTDKTKNPDRFSSRITKKESNTSKIKIMYKEMSPIFYLTKNSPPLFMMAADNDTTIPVGHTYHMKSQADKIGANVETFIVKDAGHNWRKAGGEINPTIDVITQKTIDFFLKHK